MSGSLSTAVNNTVDGSSPVVPAESERAAVDLWTRAIHRLKGRLSRHTFQTYFEPIKPVSLEGDELTLAHSSRFMIDWVRDNLLDVLLQDLDERRPVGGPGEAACPRGIAVHPIAEEEVALVPRDVGGRERRVADEVDLVARAERGERRGAAAERRPGRGVEVGIRLRARRVRERAEQRHDEKDERHPCRPV